MSTQLESFRYDNKIVKMFAYATMLWGLVGMLVGLLVALQIYIPAANFNFEFTTFGRTRPLHTNAVIFAFVGNGIFTGVYYSLPRLLKTNMWSEKLSRINFWGWQLIIVAAAVTLLAGFTSGKEYAELEWPIDIAIAAIWVVFGWNMFATIFNRRERHLYVAIWFYIATFITVAVLHIVNSFALPVSLLKSYSFYAGVQDALVQWWYGHNAVAFFLTTPYLGLMYYFVPKAVQRPVYSYKLSIIHFWALIFLYIWAGPHHLLYTSLPEWAQTLGVVFSVMLIAPSWGGMINGLLTMRGAWDRVRDSAVLKFFVVAITAYGMATFEGPLLSLKSVNAISHFTDWTVAHVHIGALGWNGFFTFGMIYWLIPKLFNTNLYSEKLANSHFWIGTIGILFYSLPLYWAGFTQYLMWQEFTPDGFLAYPNFLETVTQVIPMYAMRSVGGLLYFVGVVLFVYNIIKTTKKGTFVESEEAQAPALERGVAGSNEGWHRSIERKPVKLLVFALVVILIGGVVEMVPTFLVKSNIPTIGTVEPYTPLELQGRDVYIKEGCYNCHSQMVRPFRHETERYGDYSKSGEFVYDHPFQWGSKRTGPDLAREGSKKLRKSHSWHYNHMNDPTSMSPGSVMPRYSWLLYKDIDIKSTTSKMAAMQKLGVPYTDEEVKNGKDNLKKQAKEIADELVVQGVEEADPNKEIIALIAYLQRLGTDVEK